MKPLNSKETGCNPISSNCVIWQGPDIPCMNLCKGDTVSDVVFKLATELCQILDTLKVSTYDLSCFNLTSCNPADFQELIQFLIKRICNLEDCTGCAPGCGNTPTPPIPQPNNGCPDCEITIAPCFQYTNGLGDTVLAMQLVDYATAIGNKVCALVSSLTNTNNTVTNINGRVIVLENQVDNIISNPPVFPNVDPICVLPVIPDGYPVNVLLTALEEQFCFLRDATGNVSDIQLNIIKQCPGLNDAPRLAGSGSMSTISGWTSSVSTLADSLGNLWLTICDMRAAIQNIQANCCPSGCDAIDLSLSTNLLSNILTLYVSGSPIPAGFAQCTGTTLITISDSAGGTYSFNLNILPYINSGPGYAINLDTTPVDSSLPITVTINTCFTDVSTGTTCSSVLTSFISSSITCPLLTVLPVSDTQVNYTFASLAGNYAYNVQIYDATGTTLIASQTQTASSVTTLSGSFTTLSAETAYKVRLSITLNPCEACTPTVCTFVDVTTLPALGCPAPYAVVPEIIIP